MSTLTEHCQWENETARGYNEYTDRTYTVSGKTRRRGAMTNTLTEHCQWENEMARERIGHPSSYADAKKMNSLTLNN